MKLLIKFVLLTLFLIGFTLQAQAQINGPVGPAPVTVSKRVGTAIISYNEERNETLVQTPYMGVDALLPKDLRWQAHFFVKGKKAIEPKKIFFTFSSLTRDKTLSKKLTSKIYLEDKELVSGNGELIAASEDSFGTINAYRSFAITFQSFQQIIKAKKIKLRIGDDEFELTTEMVSALIDLQNTIEG